MKKNPRLITPPKSKRLTYPRIVSDRTQDNPMYPEQSKHIDSDLTHPTSISVINGPQHDLAPDQAIQHSNLLKNALPSNMQLAASNLYDTCSDQLSVIE